MKRRSFRRLLVSGLGLAVLALGWLYLAPPQLGGSASYAVIVGSSMEPVLHRGDLVILRESDRFEVGDVAGYRSQGHTLLHRIVGQSGSRFVFKGDNNGFVDPIRPERQQLVGTLWLHLPAVGRLFDWVRAPRNAALLAGVLALLVAGTGGAELRRRHGRRRRDDKAPSLPTQRFLLPSGSLQTVLAGCALAAIAFGLLAAVAYSRSETTAVAVSDSYSQKGSFSYSADAPVGAVYQDGEINTGEPVFLRLVDQVAVRFSYRFDSRLPRDLHGTSELDATVSDGTGWKYRWVVEPETAFVGDVVAVKGVVDLSRLGQAVNSFKTQTGSTGSVYLFTVTPRIRLTGTLGAKELRKTFVPPLAFQLEADRLTLVKPDASGTKFANTLTRSELGAGSRQVPAQLTVARFSLKVESARQVGLIGAGAAVAGLLLALLALALGARNDEPARIQGAYGQWIVPVARSSQPYERLVDVESIEALARLAQRYDRMILHEQREDGHTYLVEEGRTAYRYEVRTWPEPQSHSHLRPVESEGERRLGRGAER